MILGGLALLALLLCLLYFWEERSREEERYMEWLESLPPEELARFLADPDKYFEEL